MGTKFAEQSINIRVNHVGESIYFHADSLTDFKHIVAMKLTIANTKSIYGSTIGFRVDEKEVLDNSHEAHLLQYGTNVAPNERKKVFRFPIAVNNSKLEGVYTDSYLQGLLSYDSSNPNGGVISKNSINVNKTYVSGKESNSFNSFAADAGLLAFSAGLGTSPVPATRVYFPYDVRIKWFLSNQIATFNKQLRIVEYPIQFIVRHPLSPININAVLPSHIKKVIGIKAVHSVGVEQMYFLDKVPVLGHLTLGFNNKKYQFGNIDVSMDNSPEASNDYIETAIDIDNNSLMTGNYENKVCRDNTFVLADGTVTANWKNYIITIYLLSLCND